MRDHGVSIAKGIAIILMVLAHTRFSQYGGFYINMFHMPLFFFMSGYCFKEKYLDETCSSLHEKKGDWHILAISQMVSVLPTYSQFMLLR